MSTSKSHSWWWNSHISPRNSKWLSENLQEIDRLVNEMLKLIEEDGDSFAKKAQMYYQRRPELVSHVEDFYRMYRSLAERYDHVITDMSKNIPIELQSQGSVNGSEFGTEAASPSAPSSPERASENNLNHPKPHWRAAGFEVFNGSRASSDPYRKGSDESSSESSSDSDSGKVIDDYGDSSKLEARIIELEHKLLESRDELHRYKNESKEQHEDLMNEEHLDLASSTTSSMENQPVVAYNNFLELVKQIEVLQEDLSYYQEEIENLKETMEASVNQFEIEILCRDNTMKEFKTLEQEEMFKELKAMEAQSSNMLLQEKSVLEAKLSSLMVSSSSYEFKLQFFEERVKQLEAEKSLVCTGSEKRICELNQCLDEFKAKVGMLTSEKDELNAQVIRLIEDTESWDDESRKIDEQLHELHLEHDKLIQEIEDARKTSVSLANRVRELEDEVERQRGLIVDCSEGKKEAIRQLCFSLEHYRVGYQELRQLFQVKYQRPAVVDK